MEIIAFSNGDSRDINTWSNVPYLFLKHLEAKGDVEVHRVNLQLEDESPFLSFVVKCLNKILRLIGGNFNSIDRTEFYEYFVRKKMEQAVRSYPNSEFMVSFDFSHILPNSGMRTLLFCDWTIQYVIESHENRTPTKAEWRHIQRQNDAISKADNVVTIFPNVFDYMKKKHGEKVSYLGNFINTVEEAALDVNRRYSNNFILFVGREAYRPALISLIEAVKRYNRVSESKLTINVIGMNQSQAPKEEFVTYHGYLNKNNPREREIYYTLMNSTRVLVNTADNWVGASSIIEAMYFGTPVIIQPNEDIIKTFGEEINFGYYCENNDPKSIQCCIEKLMAVSKNQYEIMCNSAQEAVAEFTWDSYISKLRLLLNI